MDFDAFRAFVTANADHFRGVHPETPGSLMAVEHRLGVRLPGSLKWLLQTWGYSTPCGIGSLAEAVETTERARQVLKLPERYIVLNDWNDAGVVFLDSGGALDSESWPVYWSSAHNLGRVAAGEKMDADCNNFAGFAEWVKSRLAEMLDEA